MEKLCPGEEGHPPSPVNVYMRKKKLTSLPAPRADNSARTCLSRDCLALKELT